MSQGGANSSAASSTGSVSSLTGNSGGKVTGDSSGNINVVGAGVITVVGTTNTETVQIVSGSSGQILTAVTSGNATWTTATYPSTAGTSGNVLTSDGTNWISSTPGGSSETFTVITANQSIVVNNGYICNGSGTVVLTLPTTAAVGTIFEVTGMNNNTGWKIAQNAGQQIFFGTVSTTSGTNGYLESAHTYDAIRLVCNVANTSWIVLSSFGNITYN